MAGLRERAPKATGARGSTEGTSTCHGSDCHTTAYDANQPPERRSIRTLPITSARPTPCLPDPVWVSRIHGTSPMWIGSTWEILAIHKPYTPWMTANTPGRVRRRSAPQPHSASRQTRGQGVSLTNLKEAAP